VPKPPGSTVGVRSKTARQRRAFLASSDRVCGFCGGDGADTVDDVRPLILGGVDAPSNWRPAHARCNKSAGAKLGNKLRGARSARAKSASKENGTGSDFSEGEVNSAHKRPSPPQKSGRSAGTDRRASEVLSKSPRKAGTPRRPVSKAGVILPRLETPKTRGVKSLGPEAITWINASGLLGRHALLPWQEYVLHRALELRDGNLRWATVIVTVARQQGKSVVLRSQSWWRIHQAERFGEPQVLLHTANLAATAREVWRPAALHAMARYGKKAAKFGKGTEEIDLGDLAGRWLVQAASDNTGVGYSLSQVNLDEAWAISEDIFASMSPAMSEREQPQAWLVSTAGDSGSNLLRQYREQALQDTKGTGDVLLIEWSAPPEAPYDHPNTWRWASPNWSPRREKFLASQLASISEAAFRVQYLNQWVSSVDGWIPASAWAAAESDLEPEGRPDVTAVEVAPDGSRFAVVSAWAIGEAIVLRASSTPSSAVLWSTVEGLAPSRLLLPPQLHIHYTGRGRPTMVGSTEMGRHMIGVARAINEGRVLHSHDDHVLTSDVGRAVAVTTEQGMRLSIRKSPGPIEAARAMVWAVGEILRPGVPKPRIRSG
jgi:hypothetical protein